MLTRLVNILFPMSQVKVTKLSMDEFEKVINQVSGNIYKR